MHIHLLFLLLSIYQIYGHGQHAPNSQPSTGEQPHISRKMEDHVHDINHMKHDLQGQINKPVEQMSQEEQNFYYFKLHDINNDNRLDGLEVIASFDHEHEEENLQNATVDGHHNNTKNERIGDEELTNLIDDILKEEDLDRDGFISYEEFKVALEREAATHG
ncbi:unnamed protein product [Adineta steineri]|uniref:EF-hand domain-containing protein n=1 Tax=Adineta steineri TaxID=433720 RepID=A0A814M2N5_9BILA|nr:unnamed protein product [Adineta steineri]CAF3992946.1 unnamed protein product [Adineta steineri]